MMSTRKIIHVKLEKILTRREVKGKTITLKIKYYDFKSITRSITIEESADNAAVIMNFIKPLLYKTEAGARKVRLLGISISNFYDQDFNRRKCGQLQLPFKFHHDYTKEDYLW